jgi:hypothetical protein
VVDLSYSKVNYEGNCGEVLINHVIGRKNITFFDEASYDSISDDLLAVSCDQLYYETLCDSRAMIFRRLGSSK